MSAGWIALAVIMFFVLAPSAADRETGDNWRKMADSVEERQRERGGE